jgi:hypothetical protein
MERRKGIEDQLCTLKMITQLQHQCLDLLFFQVHGNTFSQEQARALAMCTHRRLLGVLEHGAGQQMVALTFIADELPAKIDDLREVQVVPFHLAIIHALEACIKATAFSSLINASGRWDSIARILRVTNNVSATPLRFWLTLSDICTPLSRTDPPSSRGI